MSVDESLTPISRLKSDSAMSPTCADSATITPTTANCSASSRNAIRSRISGPYTSAATTAPAAPPTAPAHVLRGDNTGASLGPPTSVPAAIAQVSHTHVTTSGRITRAAEARGCASLWGPWRIARMKASRADAYSAPKTVTATAVRGRRSGPRAIAASSTARIQSEPA